MNKFHWGYRIALVYGLFVSVFLALFFISLKFKNELVTPDYYAEELNYQDRLDQMNRTAELKVLPEWKVEKDGIAILFPEELSSKVTKAEVKFYRPSDSRLDKNYTNIKPDESGKISLARTEIGDGHFRLQLHWEMENKMYFKEGVVNL